MKKVWSKIACCLLLCVAATAYAETTTITVNTRNTSLIYKVDDAGRRSMLIRHSVLHISMKPLCVWCMATAIPLPSCISTE